MQLLFGFFPFPRFSKEQGGGIAIGITRFFLSSIIPFSVPQSVLLLLSPIIIRLFLGIVLLFLVVIITTGSILFSPFLQSTSPLDSTIFKSLALTLPQTDIPQTNPLGGNQLTFVTITASFHDPLYFLLFQRVHTGVDFVPSSNYYTQSEAYRKSHQVIVYATHTGTARYYVDQYGSQTVENINPEGNVKSIDMHLQSVFVKTGQCLHAGTPLGIMGQTGLATGVHLHYEIQVKDEKGNWSPVNPLGFIIQ